MLDLTLPDPDKTAGDPDHTPDHNLLAAALAAINALPHPFLLMGA